VAAGVGGTRNATSQSVSLDRAVPQGEGIGYSFTAAHIGGSGPDTSYGQAFAQVNAEHIAVSANYSRTALGEGGPSFSQVTVAGSIGASGGSVFAARPVLDSFALVRIPDQVGVPVYANGWYAGKTDSRGEVVATNLASYYDNYIRFGAADLPFDYVFESSERVISPPLRSGTLVTFDVRKNHAIVGVLVQSGAETHVPIEFRDFRLERDGSVMSGFTARRGEFYVEGVEPGAYQLHVDGTRGCVAKVMVPALAGAVTDIGTVTCETRAR
jgi:outer membrane usher protein FimD/PapC